MNTTNYFNNGHFSDLLSYRLQIKTLREFTYSKDNPFDKGYILHTNAIIDALMEMGLVEPKKVERYIIRGLNDFEGKKDISHYDLVTIAEILIGIPNKFRVRSLKRTVNIGDWIGQDLEDNLEDFGVSLY